jgi:hypothetical protein
MDHKEHWKNKLRDLTTKELEDKLKEIESHPQFDSSKSAQRILWGGGLGSAMHISDREREAHRRAIRELLGLKWQSGHIRICNHILHHTACFCVFHHILLMEKNRN